MRSGNSEHRDFPHSPNRNKSSNITKLLLNNRSYSASSSSTTSSRNNRNKKTIIATPTRSGWQYPFVVGQHLANLKFFKFLQRGKDQGLMVAVDGIIEWNRSLQQNCFVASCDITQHLNHHAKTIGCKISVGRLSGSESGFELNFTAEW